MIDINTLLSYTAACIVIILAPGPAQALVLAVTFSDGKKAGIVTVLGLNSSMIIHILAAAVGVSAILATSATAFTVIKLMGAAYLMYIGIRALLSKAEVSNVRVQKSRNLSKAYTKGFLTGALNPKVALFFLAFVPQFVNPAAGYIIIQFLVLGIILAVIDIVYESVLVVFAATFSGRLNSTPLFNKLRQKLSGLVMIALGIKMALLKQD